VPSSAIARGPGPRWVRRGLAVLAALYFAALIHHPPQWPGLRVAGFFTESTCLFPRANLVTSDYRLDAWSCADRRWAPIDPRAYFPIEASDKESRFQRFGYFYQRNKPSLDALDAWIEARHPRTEDGLAGAIGGIRLAKWTRPIPEAGSPIEPYVYHPLEPIPQAQRKIFYDTAAPIRRARCAGPP
jgi:hypothetical protein